MSVHDFFFVYPVIKSIKSCLLIYFRCKFYPFLDTFEKQDMSDIREEKKR